MLLQPPPRPYLAKVDHQRPECAAIKPENTHSDPDAQILVRIVAPHFVAGLIVLDDRAIRVAPILHYMLGWPRHQIRAYVAKRGWHANILHNSTKLP